ncbi:MAG: nucleoside/nucleotide kinase family protein [Salinisphaera sp.]|jgi:pantothenate kinase|nr:nucleoside/nucleotide kinase family protein [Salinisphaera sp.]
MTNATDHKTCDIPIDQAVIDAAQALGRGPTCRLLGIVGAPAAGKSTLTDFLVDTLGERARSVPMDGFHLSQRQLERLGRSQRKGAPDTFDGAGYRALLARVRGAREHSETVYAPGFYRDIEEPIAASLAIGPDTTLVVTEGNYLLLPESPWPDIAAMLDEVWFLHVDDGLREDWLLARHMRFGRSEAEARAWIAATDRPNAERIIACAERADRRLRWNGERIGFVE